MTRIRKKYKRIFRLFIIYKSLESKDSEQMDKKLSRHAVKYVNLKSSEDSEETEVMLLGIN